MNHNKHTHYKHYANFERLWFPGIAFFVFVTISVYSLTATAQNVELLQKNASVAYEAMMQAKKNSENLIQDAISAENKLVAAKDKFTAAEQEAIGARRKSDEAKIAYDHAQEQWKKATDALANEWGKSEIK